MDYVDIFYAHAYDNVEEVKDQRIIDELLKIKKEGKARFIGFTSHAHKPDQILAAIEAGVYDVILVSYNFKLGNLKETQEAIEKAAKAGIGIVAMKTMTGAKEDAEGNKKLDAQACLKWAWENEYITTAIPGFTNYDELDECLVAAQDPSLTESQKEYLASLLDKEMLFCQRCEVCKGQCPENLPIPDLMRAYMYAYGYKHSQLSKETLLELELAEHVCSNCETCQVTCPSGFNVSQKIAAVMPIRNVPTEFLS
jgi:predicted aldo/keto reductase-like oxidoreductase